jgi:hypothetical protein
MLVTADTAESHHEALAGASETRNPIGPAKPSSSISAADFIEIREILWSSGGLFGMNELGFPQKVNCYVFADGRGALMPCGIKIRKAGQAGEEIDLTGGNTNDILKSIMREVVLCDFDEWNPNLWNARATRAAFCGEGLIQRSMSLV